MNTIAFGDTAKQAFYIPSVNGSWAGYRSGRNPFGGPHLTGNVIVAATWTGTTLKLFINGAEIGHVQHGGVSGVIHKHVPGDGFTLGTGWGFRE
jgi:hypothetical protein